MYYFVNSMLSFHSSGIEHAQMKRLQLFKKHHVAAQIVTTEYSTRLHHNMLTYHLKDNDSVNLYDFFQQATSFKGHRTKIGDITAPRGSQMRANENIFNFITNPSGQLKMRVETWEDDYVHQVTYYDSHNHPVSIDIYDWRGFLSQRQLLGFDDRIAQRLYYSPHGKLVLKVGYTTNNQQTTTTFYQLVSFHGKDYYFDSEQELATFFFDELNQSNQQVNTFINDRAFNVEAALLSMQTRRRLFFYNHNIVVADPNDPLHSKPYSSIEQYLANQNKITGLISSTDQQREDIETRWHPKFNQYTIPVGTISEHTLHATPVSSNDRIPFKIISVARIHEQKRLEDTISVFKLIHDQLPEATLDIYGYVNDDRLNGQLHQQVKDHHLDDYVNFKNYAANLGRIYDTAQLMLVTSRYEGYGLAIMEAISHGVPVLSYDINYGPKEIITDQQTGFLFDQGSIREMADQAIKILQTPALLTKLQSAAYDSRPQFSEDLVWQQWQPVIGDHTNQEV